MSCHKVLTSVAYINELCLIYKGRLVSIGLSGWFQLNSYIWFMPLVVIQIYHYYNNAVVYAYYHRYFGTCIFNFSGLMMNYLGGRRNAMRVIADGRPVKLNVPPCCCCCICLPTVKFRPYVWETVVLLYVVLTSPCMVDTTLTWHVKHANKKLHC